MKEQSYILSGAIGTEIQRRGFQTTLPLWSAQALFDAPHILLEIYRDYIAAGATVITTNTFRTQRRTLQKVGLAHEFERINKLAVDLARKAIENSGKKILVAASVTTLEDCYRPDLVPTLDTCLAEHTAQIDLLSSLPIDFLLLETFNSVDEAEMASQAAASKKPFCVSFTVDVQGQILSGDTWAHAYDRLLPYKPDAILVNCAPPSSVEKAFEQIVPLAKRAGISFGAYANGEGEAGSEDGWDFSQKTGTMVTEYAMRCKEWHKLGAAIIGGCCGTSPEYTRAYSKSF